MRDEKMLEKLTTHGVKDVSELFNLANKCARATEGRAWHSQPAPVTGKASKPEADAAAQNSGKNKNRKKKSNNNKPVTNAPTVATFTTAAGGGRGPHGNKRLRQPSGSDEGEPWCPVHNSRHHIIEECWEIKKLLEQFREQQKQQPRCDSTPHRQREGKHHVAHEGNDEEEMEF
jgi:hypothetical protein